MFNSVSAVFFYIVPRWAEPLPVLLVRPQTWADFDEASVRTGNQDLYELAADSPAQRLRRFFSTERA
jgi:hypothetical protein